MGLLDDRAVGPAAEAAELPRAVHVKTPSRTFNQFFYFALDDAGRIWCKSIPGASALTEAVAPDWRLLQGTGLPHDHARPGFFAPQRIASINADLDEVMAVSDARRVYSLRWFENPVFQEDTPAGTWADEHGWPDRGPLLGDGHVATDRGWALGRRTRSFVLFEDIAGRTFDGGGGLSTYYLLRGDGTSIAFSDAGLPPGFRHTIGGPERSTFIAEAMEVCADTIFVINAYGELRTRMVDFDSDGSDTMFFVYSDDQPDARREAIARPAEDWIAHPAITLDGAAQIATRLAIVLTGRHNHDRELRVAGYDRDRRPGYYFKRIAEPARDALDAWQFAADDSVVLEPDRLLDPADTDPCAARAATRSPVPTRWRHTARPPRRAAARNMAFVGELRVDGVVAEITAEVVDFHLDWSPARLRFSSGEDAIDVTLHTTEKPSHRLRFDPGHDGTAKELQATLELSISAFTTGHPALRALARDVLARFDLVAFAWFVRATEHALRIESKPARQTVPAWPRVSLQLVRKRGDDAPYAGAPQGSLRDAKFTAAAHATELEIGRPLAELTGADAVALQRKIADNLDTARTLVTSAGAPVRQDAETPAWLQPSVLGALRYAARPWLLGIVLPLLPFRTITPAEATHYARNMAAKLPRLLERSRALKDALLGGARHDLAHALMLIDTRIAAYTRRLAQLAGTTSDHPFSYFEDVAGFWEPLRFGRARLETMPTLAAPWVCMATVCDDEMVAVPPAGLRASPPAIIVEVDCHESEELASPKGVLALRIMPTHLERDFYQASIRADAPVGSMANPLRTAVDVQVHRDDGTPVTQAVLDRLFHTGPGVVSLRAAAELAVQGGRYSVTGDGFRLAWRAGS